MVKLVCRAKRESNLTLTDDFAFLAGLTPF